MKNNASQRNAIKKEVEGHVSEFHKNVEEIMEIKKNIEEIEIHKINEDYINNQISYTSISNNLNFTIEGNNYSKTKELFHIIESKNNEKVEGTNAYDNSIIYFRFIYFASFLYSNDVETISKVCKLIVDNIVQIGKRSKNGNFILRDSGNYIFRNFNLFIILMKGANYALRFLFQKSFGKDLHSSFIHFNAILSAVLLVDILMKKKSCIAKLSFDHFSFFFINTIVCLSIYTKVIHTNKYIYLFKNGDIARSLVTSILNNLLGREFLTSHSKLLEYVCSASFSLGFDIMKNNKILIDDISDTSEFYIYINTYIKILNKIYKKIMNKIYEENKVENNFVYRIVHILFMNLNKYDICLFKMENDKNRKRKMDVDNEEKVILRGNSGALYNKKVCKGRRSGKSNDKGSGKNDGTINEDPEEHPCDYSDCSIFDCQATYYENLGSHDGVSNNNDGGNSYRGSNKDIIKDAHSANNEGTTNDAYSTGDKGCTLNNSDSRCLGTLGKGDYEGMKRDISIRKKDIYVYSKEELEKIQNNRIDFMNKYLFFIQLIFYGIKKNNPLILLAYINHEIIDSYNNNLKYYFKKMELLLNKDLGNCVSSININNCTDIYSLDFSFEHFLNEHNHLKESKLSIFNSYKNVFSQYTNFDSEIIYNNFDLSIDDVILKKREFLESLKMININELSFDHNKYEHLKQTIIEYINELENTQVLEEIQNVDVVSDYNFLCTMYRIPKGTDKDTNQMSSNDKQENAIPNNGRSNNRPEEENNLREGAQDGQHNERNENKVEDRGGDIGRSGRRSNVGNDKGRGSHEKDDENDTTVNHLKNSKELEDTAKRFSAHILEEANIEEGNASINSSGSVTRVEVDSKEKEENKEMEEHKEGEEQKELTFISHSIYLRNETIENVDMNTLRDKYNSPNNFSSSIITEKVETKDRNRSNNKTDSSHYSTEKTLIQENNVLSRNMQSSKPRNSMYEKMDQLNIFNYNKFCKSNERESEKNGTNNQEGEIGQAGIVSQYDQLSQTDQANQAGIGSQYGQTGLSSQTGIVSECDRVSQINDQIQSRHPYDRKTKDEKEKNTSNDNFNKNKSYNHENIRNKDHSKKMKSENHIKIFEDEKNKNRNHSDGRTDYSYKEKKLQEIQQVHKMRSEYNYLTCSEIKKKTHLLNDEQKKEKNNSELICKNGESGSKSNMLSYRDETENKSIYAFRREKSNDGKFRHDHDKNRSMMKNASTSNAINSTVNNNTEPFSRSKTNVKYLINKYKNQKEPSQSFNLKTCPIFSQKKDSYSIQNMSSNSSSNNNDANKTIMHKLHNKLPFQIEKKKNYVYERSISSISSISDMKTKTDRHNLIPNSSPDHVINSSLSKRNFSNNCFHNKNDKKFFIYSTNSNSSNNVTYNSKNDAKSSTTLSSCSTKRKNQVGISIPLKKSIL
ncbi:conserved Plasmodium protein, unknown function [Plasmodium malariae]|uniref:Uncharacterized protein n=1 Tax=Plasmodium malariae TaxID=5858 RepID=A0A1A8WGB7_PLAMA|nr:conserved Plasmodium protein, unknown function [Plasmodium malariae]